MRVACIGDNCVDVYTDMDGRYYCTGNCVDFGVHMKRLGAEVSLISTVANDGYGEEMMKMLEREGIDTSHVSREDGSTAISYMQLIDGERTYGDYIEGVMEDVKFTDDDIGFTAAHDLVQSAFWGNAHMHFPNLKEKGATIAFDFADETDDPLVEKVIPYVDYAFFSFEHDTPEVREYIKDKTEKGVKIAIATFGVEGSLAFDGENYHKYGIVKAEELNSVGAGDSYMAGFMNGILKGWPIEECQKQGAEVAAKVVAVFDPF